MKTAIYCRVASASDDAIAVQEALMLNFAGENGFDDCVCYRDNGEKGSTLNRPGFNALMAAIDSGEVGCVIVREFSRICRSYSELDKWLKAMERKGIRLIVVNDAYDTSKTLEGEQFPRFLELLQAEMHHERSQKIKAGIEHAKRRKAASQA